MPKKNLTPEEKEYKEMVEEIATNIAKLSRQVSSLLNGRLKREAIIILLAQMTKLPKRDIEYVLNAIESMEDVYLKKSKE